MIRVLHVEENPEDIELTKARLLAISDQISVDSVDSVLDALEVLKREKYDCILCDYQMPEVSGIELLKQLRKEGNQTPFILLTGRGDEEVAAEALRCGVDDYYNKETPLPSFEEVFTGILRVVEENRFRASKKAIENAQMAEHQRLVGLLEKLPAIVALVEPNKSVQFANKLFWENFGPPEGITCHSLLYGREKECVECPMTEVLISGHPHKSEITISQGETFQISYHPLGEADGLSLMLILGTNISERKALENKLKFRIELEALVSSLSTRLINTPVEEIDGVINTALEKIGRFIGADRSYAFIFSEDLSLVETVHEWCAEGMESQKAKTEGVDPWSFPWLMGKISRFETVHVPRTNRLPAKAAALKKLTKQAGTRSFVQVPMACGDRLVGSISFATKTEERHWSDESIALLRIVGEMFANALMRKRVEKELRVSQERYRIISELTSDYTFSVHVEPDGRITREWVAGAYTEITGYDPEEADPENWKKLTHPEDMHIAIASFKRHLANESHITELRIITKDGKVRWIRNYGSQVWDKDEGRVMRIIGATRDITERKLAEEALKESEARYRAICEISSDCAHSLRIRPDGTLEKEWTTGTSDRITGYEEDELEPDEWLTVVHPDDVEIAREHIRLNVSGEPHAAEFRIITKSGETRWVRNRGFPIWDEKEKRPVRIICATRNITERKIQEEEQKAVVKILNKANTTLNTTELMQGMADNLQKWCGCDAVGIRLRKNDDFPFFETVGYPDEFTDQENRLLVVDKWEKPIFDEDGSYMYSCACGDVIKGLSDPEKSCWSKNGSFWTNNLPKLLESEDRYIARMQEGCLGLGFQSVALVPLRFGDETIGLLQFNCKQKTCFTPGLISAMERVSNTLAIAFVHKRMEEELQQSRDDLKEKTTQLASANRELKSFSYSVAHDLRAPLRHIQGFSKILLEEQKDKLDEKGTKHLQILHNTSTRMSQLIDDLLKLAQVSQDKLSHTKVNLSAIAEDVAKSLGQSERERHINFVIARGLSALGDPRLLQVVVENLMGNACKFTSKIPEAIIEFGSTRIGEKTAFYVRDNGIGFSMDSVDKLFTPFQRLHKPSEFEGSGIGLATVQRIVERHGGQVWAEGKEGKGATFYFTLMLPG